MSENNPPPLPATDPEQVPRAAADGDADAVKALLAAGASVDGSNHYQQTPLIRAAFFGHVEVVRVLLTAGADPHAKDKLGLTALDWSMARGFPEVTHLLRLAAPDMAVTKEIKPEPEPPTAPLPEEVAADLPARDSSDTQPLHFTNAFTRAMREAKFGESTAEVPDESLIGTDEPFAEEIGNTFIETTPPQSGTQVVETAPDLTESQVVETAPDLTESQVVETARDLNESQVVGTDSAGTGIPGVESAQNEMGTPASEIPTDQLLSPATLAGAVTPLSEIPTDQLPSQVTSPEAGTPVSEIPTDQLPSQAIAAEMGMPVSEIPTDQLPSQATAAEMGMPVSEIPTDKLPSQATTEPLEEGEYPTRPLTDPAELEARLDQRKQLADTAQDISDAPIPAAESASDEPSDPMVIVDAETELPDENPTRPLSQFSFSPAEADEQDDAPTQSLSDLFAEAELRDTLGKEKLAEPSPTSRISEQSPWSPSADVANLNAAASGVTGRLYPPRNSIAARNASRDVSRQFAPAAELPPRHTGRILLLVMLAALVLATIPVGYLIMSRRSAESVTTDYPTPAPASNPTKTTQTSAATSSPIVEGAIKGSEISVPQAEYPELAKSQGINGSVTVAVIVGRGGKVLSAKAVDGPDLLRNAAVSAARNALFTPAAGQRSGSITYHFGKTGGTVPDVATPGPGTKNITPQVAVYPAVDGEVKGSEILVPNAEYPAAARRLSLAGMITVAISVNSEGQVTAARATGGSNLLRRAAELAARKALFKAQSGPPRSGTITYEMGPLGQS